MSLLGKLKNFAVGGLIGLSSCSLAFDSIYSSFSFQDRAYPYPNAVEVYQSENTESPQEALKTDGEPALIYPRGKIIIRFNHPLWGLFPTFIYTTNETQESTNLDIYALEIEDKEIKQRIYALSKELTGKRSYEAKLEDTVKSSNYKTNAIEIINQGPNTLRLDAIREFLPI